MLKFRLASQQSRLPITLSYWSAQLSSTTPAFANMEKYRKPAGLLYKAHSDLPHINSSFGGFL